MSLWFQDESALIWFSGKEEKHLKLSHVSRIISGQRTVSSLCWRYYSPFYNLFDMYLFDSILQIYPSLYISFCGFKMDFEELIWWKVRWLVLCAHFISPEIYVVKCTGISGFHMLTEFNDRWIYKLSSVW